MAAQREMLGLGSTLSFDTNATTGTDITVAYTGTYTAVSSLLTLSIPEIAYDDVEVTKLSHTDKAMRFKAGMYNAGEISATAQYFDTEDTTLQGLKGLTAWYKLTFPDGSGSIFQGYLKTLGGKVEMKSVIERNITIKLSGPVYDVAAT